MSERQEIYRYAVGRECASAVAKHDQQCVRQDAPLVGRSSTGHGTKDPSFLTALRAFLATPDDPTGLKLSHLREQARELSHSVEEVSGLLAQIVWKQEEPS